MTSWADPLTWSMANVPAFFLTMSVTPSAPRTRPKVASALAAAGARGRRRSRRDDDRRHGSRDGCGLERRRDRRGLERGGCGRGRRRDGGRRRHGGRRARRGHGRRDGGRHLGCGGLGRRRTGEHERDDGSAEGGHQRDEGDHNGAGSVLVGLGRHGEERVLLCWLQQERRERPCSSGCQADAALGSAIAAWQASGWALRPGRHLGRRAQLRATSPRVEVGPRGDHAATHRPLLARAGWRDREVEVAAGGTPGPAHRSQPLPGRHGRTGLERGFDRLEVGEVVPHAIATQEAHRASATSGWVVGLR